MARVEVMMPQMGESVMEGTVIQWNKNIGDEVQVDDTLLEIATDKVDTEVPSPEAGILVEVLAGEGDVVEVGKPIAVIETDVEQAVAAQPAAPAAQPQAPAAEEPVSADLTESSPAVSVPAVPAAPDAVQSQAPSGQPVEGIPVVMPQMGESVMEGTIIEWKKSVGDRVEADDTLLEIATDKVDTEVPSPESGYLVQILAEAGEKVQVGQPIAMIASAPGAPASPGAPAAAQASAPSAPPAEPAAALPAVPAPTVAEEAEAIPRKSDSGRFYSPLVRSIAQKEGIPVATLDRIPGSGQNGRLTKDDLLGFLQVRPPEAGAPSARPAASAGGSGLTRPGAAPSRPADGSIHAGELHVQAPRKNVEIVKMDRMRKMIAEHMVKSRQTSAHVTTFADVDVTGLVKWREANKDRFQKQTGFRLTFTPLFVEAIIQAIREFPLINSSVVGDEIHVKRDINFGLAVALGEGGKGGLIVPVIKNAQEKNLVGLADAVNGVAAKARGRTLSPDDLVGGTITLTNYGSVGNLMGTPIINQPQVAIIGTGVIEKRPVVMETELGDVIAIRRMMYLSMSYDHRIIDGAHGGAFLSRVKHLLENYPQDRTF